MSKKKQFPPTPQPKNQVSDGCNPVDTKKQSSPDLFSDYSNEIPRRKLSIRSDPGIQRKPRTTPKKPSHEAPGALYPRYCQNCVKTHNFYLRLYDEEREEYILGTNELENVSKLTNYKLIHRHIYNIYIFL